MKSINEYELDDEPFVVLVYVMFLGVNADNLNIYHFMFSEVPDDVFMDGWADKPACLIPNEYMTPETSVIDSVIELKTNITFDLAQDSCCFSMQDCRDGCVALASENLDEAEEYPEPFRMVFNFGEERESVEQKLRERNLMWKDI